MRNQGYPTSGKTTYLRNSEDECQCVKGHLISENLISESAKHNYLFKAVYNMCKGKLLKEPENKYDQIFVDHLECIYEGWGGTISKYAVARNINEQNHVAYWEESMERLAEDYNLIYKPKGLTESKDLLEEIKSKLQNFELSI